MIKAGRGVILPLPAFSCAVCSPHLQEATPVGSTLLPLRIRPGKDSRRTVCR